MIVIKPRYTLPRLESGSGIIGNLIKKAESQILNKALAKSIAHSAADIVVKGAKSAAKSVVHNAIIESLKPIKRPATAENNSTELTQKRQKLNAIINGSGIVLD
tara:strand:- start:2350 stop:2661 length:312 start_codon:yes stop_codon:yes gene_type:complete